MYVVRQDMFYGREMMAVIKSRFNSVGVKRSIGSILLLFCLGVSGLVFSIGCEAGDSSLEEADVTITNNTSGSVTVYYAWENDDNEISQHTEVLESGQAQSIRIQTSIFKDGEFSARNATNVYHTYDLSLTDSGALPINIVEGDF